PVGDGAGHGGTLVPVTATDSATDQVVTIADIDAAARRIREAINSTNLAASERLSEQTGARILLKREDQQDVRSYKIRGAYNLMAQLTGDERSAGVVTASAGNHAQGVAFACRVLGINGRIYVPNNTPKQKRDRILSHGRNWVELVVTGVNFDAAQSAARADAARTGATMVPPFDHPDTMAGQGTIAAEILAQLDETPDAIVVPVGGGGLLGGIATYVAEYAPDCKVIAVEPTGAPSLTRALEAGEPVTLEDVDTFVDGASVAR